MIDIKFFDSSSKYGIIKATVHKTGKLGFSSGASKFMNLEETNYVNIGSNNTDPDDDCLYIIKTNEKTDKSFKIVKAGAYHYISIKNILIEMEIEYEKDRVVFDIEKVNSEDETIYKLCRRASK